MNATTAIQELRQLKAEAREQRRQGDQEGELRTLQLGVQRGQAAMSDAPQDSTGGTLAWEVADCLGVLGGALLRQGRVQEAIATYQKGRDLEQSYADAVHLTYNTVNLFVARLLNGGWQTLEGSEQDLQDAIARLKSRAASDGARDVWNWADLGMCSFLAADAPNSLSAYKTAATLGSADERKAILGGLYRIEQVCQPIPPDRASLLQSVKNALAQA